MQKRIFLFFVLMACALEFSFGADPDTALFFQKELELISIHSEINNYDGQEKKAAELRFRQALKDVIALDNSEEYTFDSIKVFGRIASSDNKVFIYSWNIPQKGGYNNYYCIIQYFTKKGKEAKIFVLDEKIGFLSQNEQGWATVASWPGALYYEIVTTKYKGQVYYTVFGFDFNNLLSNRKVIECFTFDDSDQLIFTQGAFVYEGRPKNRIVFEYNERVQMTLRYSATAEMILFDHLSPQRPSLQGQYQFYGPDLSYDGLVFEDGVWIHKSDVQPAF